ncbi:TldD/PmbA family protein [Candidatus Micrarchaeota archaeon]|nr:MAG: TldD/PmbA family protein [Candidatus Micrarchaeota archaeon]
MFDFSPSILNADVDYIEFRASKILSNSISVKNARLEKVSSDTAEDFCFRVMVDGAWGMASSNRFDKIDKIKKEAIKMAKLAKKRTLESFLSEEKTHTDSVEAKVKVKNEDIPIDRKIKDLIEMNKEMKIDKRIVNYSLQLSELKTEKYFINSESTEIFLKQQDTLLSFSSYAKAGILQSSHDVFGAQKGYELVKENWGKGRRNAEKSISLLYAKRIKPGSYDVVLDGKMAGVLAHEAVGHASEADAVLTGESCFSGKLGKRLASELVSIVDNPRLKYQYGSYPYDDEGVKSSKTSIIEKGILKTYLHSRETAYKLNSKSTANARAQHTNRFQLVRMSNTYFDVGDFSRDEIFDLKHGIYLEGSSGGVVDVSTGDFQFAAELGKTIKNGEETGLLRDVVIHGNILKVLQKVDALGKKIYLNPGICGKGSQLVRVSSGGPLVRIRGVNLA